MVYESLAPILRTWQRRAPRASNPPGALDPAKARLRRLNWGGRFVDRPRHGGEEEFKHKAKTDSKLR